VKGLIIMTKAIQLTDLEIKVNELKLNVNSLTKIANKNSSLMLDTAILYNSVIVKAFGKKATKEQIKELNEKHLSKLNQYTKEKVSGLANTQKLCDITKKCPNQDLKTLKDAVELETGEKSFSKIKKALKSDTAKKETETETDDDTVLDEDGSVTKTKKVKVMTMPDEIKNQADFIQWFLAQSPATQYKIITYSFNLDIDMKDKDNVIDPQFLSDVISLVPAIYTPALIENA
tara:strand:- start:1819 stop:2514 length:696 start_codon:yes stop_codon:yes gene_type:complete